MKSCKQGRIAVGMSMMVAACDGNTLTGEDGDAPMTMAEHTVAGPSAEASAPVPTGGRDASEPTRAEPRPDREASVQQAENDAGLGDSAVVQGSASPGGEPDCAAKYRACILQNAADFGACVAEAAACGQPSAGEPAATACPQGLSGCDPTSASDAGCVDQPDACSPAAVAITAESVELATDIVAGVTSGVNDLLDALGRALGIELVTDAVGDVLDTVIPIVRCATFTDYLRCVQANPDKVESCAGEAEACGFTGAAPDVLATAAECADQLSRCATVSADCIAQAPACERFAAADIVRGVSGIATNSVADIFDALTPLVQCEGRQDDRTCQCSLEYARCAEQEPSALAECVIALSACMR